MLEIKGLVKRYKDHAVVDNIDLMVEDGEIFGLLGPNGAGKTTTINAICGLTNINSGEIKIFGKSMGSSSKEVKKNMGVVPQDIALMEDLSAYENVMFFGKLLGLRGSDLKKRVEEAFNFTGLWDKRKERPGKFSGGMKRRLNIACAIVNQPQLIIMDEPTVGIDPQSRNHILESIKELNRMGSTIIYTSHYMEEIEDICTRIAIMDHGKIIAQGTKDELKAMIATEEKVEVELSEYGEEVIEAIKSVPGVKKCILNEDAVTIVSEKNSKNLGHIIEAVANVKSEILTINVLKPSLEGVFLDLTGRTLRD